ncbi:hypothetical protein HHL17_09940 [Chitinophaga sp. G-6-1-13]|uniref:Uncharacterized protein n=1 Tax=Chitinophaga fulva TaxID=2728842 RepID=A0A848GLD5_9BACT|nr:hypothetical protein [Chitinophaga fulva]NML37510.1 hypothetical protein [Chitinophaga fulva]
MNITITEVKDKYLLFDSPRGQGIGFFANQRLEPGSNHGVEFDFMEDLHTNVNTRIGTTRMFGFYQEDDFVIVVGNVESVDEDDVICLRIDMSCIILAYKSDVLIREGDTLEIRLHKDQFKVTSIGTGY